MLIFKSFIIGLGKILPGVSGSVLAISFGLYEKIIKSFSCFFKNPKENFKFLIQFFIGVLLAIIIGSKILYYFINKYYLFMIFIISGFILGSLVNLIKKTKYSKKNIIVSIISFLFTFLVLNIKFNININMFTIFLLGLLEALTSIVPGISGSAILINLGVYHFVLKGISCVDINFLMFYCIGILVGLIIFSKIINKLIDNNNDLFSAIINGLVLSSLLLMFKNCLSFSLAEILIGIMLFIFTSFISYLNT